MKENNLKTNKKDIGKIIFIVGLIIGIFLIIAGVLIFWSEDFNDLLIKFISFLKQRSPYLLVEGEPVYVIWLIKLIMIGKASIITGATIFLFSLIIFIDSRYKKILLKIIRNSNYQKYSFLVIIFLAYVFLMKWCGISFLQLTMLIAITSIQFLVGIILIKPIDPIIKLIPLKILLSWVIGVSVFGLGEFILGHREIYGRLLIIGDFKNVSWIILGIYILLILIKIKYIKIKIGEYARIIHKNNINYGLLIILFALMISVFIVSNLSPDGAMSFGAIVDKTDHLYKYTKIIIENNGYPAEVSQVGLQNQLVIYSFTLGFGKLEALNFIKANTFYGTLSLIAFLLLIYYFCKNIYNLKSKISLIVSICIIFFGAINWPLFRFIRAADGQFITSYLGFFNSSPTLYHNTTQQYSILLVLASYILIILFITNKKDPYKILTYSGILAVLSFFIKPNAFIFLGPIIFILSFYKLIKDRRPKWLIPIAVIVIPVIFQILYFNLFKIGSPLLVDLKIDFLGFYYLYFFRKYPLLGNMYLLAFFIIFVRSFAGLVLPTIFSRNNINKKIIYLNNITFVFTFLVSAFIVEGNAAFIERGNFSWVFAAFYILYIPYLFKITIDIKKKIIKYIAFFILGLHAVGGLLHLIVITGTGTIYFS